MRINVFVDAQELRNRWEIMAADSSLHYFLFFFAKKHNQFN